MSTKVLPIMKTPQASAVSKKVVIDFSGLSIQLFPAVRLEDLSFLISIVTHHKAIRPSASFGCIDG